MRRLEDPRALTWLRRAVAVVLVAGVVACAGEAGSGPADPTLLPEGTTQGPVTSAAGDGVVTVERTPLPGFGEVAVEVIRVDGQVLSWCLLLADTPELRQRGLMTVTDPELGGYDGMLFRFDAPTDGGFWMRNTPQPLSIAFLDVDGGLVSTAEMPPCEDSPDCPGYAPAGPYLRTVEVPTAVGGVAALGIEPGARLTDLGRPCSETDGT
jgi:uncharacterized membrane protein (UPF0127 family)